MDVDGVGTSSTGRKSSRNLSTDIGPMNAGRISASSFGCREPARGWGDVENCSELCWECLIGVESGTLTVGADK